MSKNKASLFFLSEIWQKKKKKGRKEEKNTVDTFHL